MEHQPSCSGDSGITKEWSSSGTCVKSGSSACVSSESSSLLSDSTQIFWNTTQYTCTRHHYHLGHCWVLVTHRQPHCVPGLLEMMWALCPVWHPFHQNIPSSPCCCH